MPRSNSLKKFSLSLLALAAMTLVSCGPTSTTAPSSSATPTVTPTTATTSTPAPTTAPTTSSETPTTSSSEAPTTSEGTSSSETSSEESSSTEAAGDKLATEAVINYAEGYDGEIRQGTGAYIAKVSGKDGLLPLDAVVSIEPVTDLAAAAKTLGIEDDKAGTENAKTAVQKLSDSLHLAEGEFKPANVSSFNVSFANGVVGVTAGAETAGQVALIKVSGVGDPVYLPVVSKKDINAQKLSKIALASKLQKDFKVLVRAAKQDDITKGPSKATLTASIVPGDPDLFPVNATKLNDQGEGAKNALGDETGLDWSSDQLELTRIDNGVVEAQAVSNAEHTSTVTATYYIPDEKGNAQPVATASASFDVVDGFVPGSKLLNNKGQANIISEALDVNGEWKPLAGSISGTNEDGSGKAGALDRGDWIASGTKNDNRVDTSYEEDGSKSVSAFRSNIDTITFNVNRHGNKKDNDLIIGLGDSFIGSDTQLAKTNDDRTITWKTFTVEADPSAKTDATTDDDVVSVTVKASDLGFDLSDAKTDTTYFSAYMNGREELTIESIYITLAD